MPSSMLPLPPFALERPTSVAHALRAHARVRDAGQSVQWVSGGTDLLPSMKYGLFAPHTLVSTAFIPDFTRIAPTDDGGLAIGAGATLAAVRRHPLVRERYASLAEACGTVATPTIQAMGTLGGNVLLDTRCIWYNQSEFWRNSLGGCLKCAGEVCHVAPKGKGCYAAHSADTVPTLMVLDARVELAGVRGTRQVAVADLWSEDGRTWARVEPGELLTRVLLPPPAEALLGHRKLRPRGAIDYPLLLTAVRVDLRNGRPSGGRVVLSALGPQPVEVVGAGPAIAAGDVAEVAELAWKQAQPLATHHWASTWRKKMVRVEVRRALAALLEPGQEASAA